MVGCVALFAVQASLHLEEFFLEGFHLSIRCAELQLQLCIANTNLLLELHLAELKLPLLPCLLLLNLGLAQLNGHGKAVGGSGSWGTSRFLGRGISVTPSSSESATLVGLVSVRVTGNPLTRVARPWKSFTVLRLRS